MTSYRTRAYYPNLVGQASTFPVPFPYLSPSTVHAFLIPAGRSEEDASEVGFEWSSSGVIAIEPAPSGGATLLIRRITPAATPLSRFGASTLSSAQLNLQVTQLLFLQQENEDAGLFSGEASSRSILSPARDDFPGQLPPAQDRAGKALVFDAQGLVRVMRLGDNLDDSLREDLAKAGGQGLVNMLPLNVRGDGLTDDHLALSLAAQNLAEVGGGTLLLPVSANGKFVITDTLRIPSRVTLQGGAGQRYPFTGVGSIVARFTDPMKWVVEADTRQGGLPIPYNEMVTALPDQPAYNCGLRDIVVTSEGLVPYGGVRFQGAPGSFAEGVSVNGPGTGALVNFCTGGHYELHTIHKYYGIIAWDDANANSFFNCYVTQEDPTLTTVPTPYRFKPLVDLQAAGSLSGGAYRLDPTKDYSAMPVGHIHGSKESASIGNTLEMTIEYCTVASVILRAYATNYTRMYWEGKAGQTQVGLVAALWRGKAMVHAYMEGAGSLVDFGVGVRAKIAPAGIVNPGGWGRGPWLDSTSRVVLEDGAPDDIGPVPPQFNVLNEVPGAWRYPDLINGWQSPVGQVPVSYRLRMGMVDYRGVLTGGTPGQPAFTLPQGFRPNGLLAINGGSISASGAVTPALAAIALQGLCHDAEA